MTAPAPSHARVPGPPPRPWRLEPIVFAGLLLAHLVPLWAMAHVPTQDGPAHVENATALRRLSRVPILAEDYELRPRLVPNWFSQGLLVALLTVLPPGTAEKALWAGYVAGLPVGDVGGRGAVWAGTTDRCSAGSCCSWP